MNSTATELTTWRSNREHLHATLIAAQAHRRERDEFMDGEIGWVTYERQVMADEVNRLRARVALPPVHIDQIRRAEDLAVGHCDYTAKYAIGCADLTLAEEDR